MKPLLFVVALCIGGCGGESFTGAPSGDDAAVVDDGGGADRADGTSAASHDASGDDAAGIDATANGDAAAADAHEGIDATSALDASFDAIALLPDAGHALMACETCLEADCSSAVQTCEADVDCSETIQCVIASGCFGADAGIDACIMQCEASEGLTPVEKVQVTMDILAMSTCAPPCASSCSISDGGAH